MKPFVKRYVLVAMLGVGAVVFGGCASREKKHEYETSPGQRSALEIPPDLTKPKSDGAMVVPDAATQPAPETGASADAAPTTKGDVIIAEPATSSSSMRSSRPGSMGEDVLPASDNIRLERAGSQRWLVVKAPPAQVWDMVREFLVAKEFKIAKASRDTGVMETDWSESRPIVGTSFQKSMAKALGSKYSNSFRDKFRVRLERGKTPDTTEVYISHSGMEEVVASKATDIVETRWQGRPNDPGLEAEMLTQFLVRAGLKEARAQAVVNAPAPADEAALHIAGDKVSLQLRDSLDSAWKRVGLALDRVGWVVEDRIADAHTYRVRQVDVVEPKKKKGFLGLFGDDEPVEKQREFVVALTESGNLVEITLRDGSGAPVARKEAQPLMELLYGQLR